MLHNPRALWDSSVTDPDLAYHLKLVDLFATMCLGENRSAEGMFQTIFDIDTVLNVLAEDSVAFVCKMPYARFLNSVYMGSSATRRDPALVRLHKDARLWQFLQKFVYPFLTERLRSVDLSNAAAARLAFDSNNLYFLFSGIVPFLQMFFDHFYVPNEASHDEASLSMALAHALFRLMDKWMHIVRDNLQYPASIKLVKTIGEAVGDTNLVQTAQTRLDKDVATNPGVGCLRAGLREFLYFFPFSFLLFPYLLPFSLFLFLFLFLFLSLPLPLSLSLFLPFCSSLSLLFYF